MQEGTPFSTIPFKNSAFNSTVFFLLMLLLLFSTLILAAFTKLLPNLYCSYLVFVSTVHGHVLNILIPHLYSDSTQY